MIKNFTQKNKSTWVFKGHYWLNQLVKTTMSFKKKIIPLALIFSGFAIQSLGMEEPFQIWQEGVERKDTSYMKEMSSAFNSLSEYWRIQPYSDLGETTYEIVGFPGKNRPDQSVRDYSSYRPLFPNEDFVVDSLIFTRSDNCNFLDNFWPPNGFSSHVVIAPEVTIFIHADVLKGEKSQMAGIWNNRSFEVVFIDEGDQKFSSDQQNALKDLLSILERKSPNLQLKYGGSIWDAKQVQKVDSDQFISGKVANIEEVLEFLELKPFNEYFQKPEDVTEKYI